MSIRMQTRIAAYALALIALWAVTFTDYFSLAWPVVSTVLVLAGWFWEGPREQQLLYKRMWMVLIVLMLVAFPFDVVSTRSLLLPAVHLSIFAQAYSLLNKKTQKSYRRILTVSFAQILASTNLTTDLRFAFLISAYCLAVAYLVLLLYMQSGMETEKPDGGEAPQGMLLLSIVLAVAMLPLSLSFFYSMPRLRYALIARNNPIDSLEQLRKARQRTGFTKIVELGTFGRVQEDDTLALRVEIPSSQGRPIEKPLKWRGGAMNIYDGAAWSSSRDYFRYYDGKRWRMADNNMGMIYPRRDNVFVADEDFVSDLPEQLDADSALLKQVFYLEVPFSDSLFGAGDIKVVQGPFTYGIGRDFNTSFYISNRQALPDLMSYTAYSSVEQPPPDILRQASQSDFQKFTHDESYSEYVRQSFLQLPTSLNPQVRQLAEELTKDIEAPYDKIVAIQQFLETRYTYSLDLEKPMTDDPLHDFLFISRSGHCEYFATAMAVMCRSIGIPARLVRGFQPGEWNDLGQFYEVRQSDSHAWVEVLFPEPRWVEFDPSPRAAADEYFNSRRSFLARMFSKRLLQLQIFWRQNVIGYNETRRLRLYGEMKEFARELPGALAGGLGKALGGTRGTHVTILLIVMLLVSALWYPAKKLQPILAPRLRSLASRRRRGNGSAFYEKMLKVLEKRKIVKPAHLTPLEFLDLPSLRLHPKLTDIETLTDLYYQTRYGGRSLESGELASVSAMLANIKRVNGRANGSTSHGD